VANDDALTSPGAFTNLQDEKMAMTTKLGFLPFALRHGMLCDMRTDEFPSTLRAWSEGILELAQDDTHFGFVFSGEAHIHCASGSFTIAAGMYFAIQGSGTVSGNGQGIVVSRHGSSGVFQLGGPVESAGRLHYIDGCTDSLLISPVRRGDACLNLLCFHGDVDQTAHTHPSMRVGIVVDGAGLCRGESGVVPLAPGMAFVIPAGKLHAFATHGQPMRVIAFHPDSDFGPTHRDHPMINRTMVDGISAAALPHLQTK
jgi:mannose-6-phosphate isomerase-like protein (cupin superfamily)